MPASPISLADADSTVHLRAVTRVDGPRIVHSLLYSTRPVLCRTRADRQLADSQGEPHDEVQELANRTCIPDEHHDRDAVCMRYATAEHGHGQPGHRELWRVVDARQCRSS